MKYFFFSLVLQKLRLFFAAIKEVFKVIKLALRKRTNTLMALFRSAAEIHFSAVMHKPSSRRQRGVFSFRGQKHRRAFQSIASVLVFGRAVSAQALDNALFDGVQWLTRPHLSPRPSPALQPTRAPMQKPNALRHPPTDSCTHTHTHTPVLALCICPLEDSSSCLCY